MKPHSGSGGSLSPPELISDSALETPDQDRLDRVEFAKAAATSILNLAGDQPFTVGIHGPPGSGKSTVLHFIRHFLAQPARLGAGGLAADPIVVVSFNPSWFPDPQQIPAQFFAAVRVALSSAGGPLEKAAAPMAQFAAAFLKAGPSDLYKLKQECAAAMRAQDARVLVIADDLDRLSPEALTAFFQLIAAAGMPRFLFLLALDRDAAAHSLAADHVFNPEAYLGRAIQLPFDVPEPDKFTLRQMLIGEIADLFAGAPAELYSEHDWEQFFWQGLDPLLAGPRDLNHFVNALRSTYPAIRQEVNFVDFSAVQTLRLFAPGMYRFLIANKPMLTGNAKEEMNEKAARMARIESMKRALEAVPETKRKPVDHILQCLFPEWETGISSLRRHADSRARLERRVSSADVFDVYFNPNIPAGALTRTEIRSILEFAPSPSAFTARLMELQAQEGRAGKSRLEAFLEHMQDYTRQEIPIAHIPALLEAFFASGDRFCSKIEREPIPSRRNDFQLLAIVSQLLARLPDEATRADLLKQILPSAEAIYAAMRFVMRIDPETSRDAAGWSTDTAKELRVIVLARIRELAAEGDLADAPYLDTVFHIWENWATSDEPKDFADKLASADDGVAALILGALAPLAPGETHFRSNLDFLRNWTSLDFADLAPKCREWMRVKPVWMTEARHVALEAFVNAAATVPLA